MECYTIDQMSHSWEHRDAFLRHSVYYAVTQFIYT